MAAQSFPASFRGTVTDRSMTVDAAGRPTVLRLAVAQAIVDQIMVTMTTAIPKHAAVARPDHQRVAIVLQSEPLGVPEPVLGLGIVFVREVVRRVAVVADGDGMVAGLLPAVVVVAHDVAVDARPGVVA